MNKTSVAFASRPLTLHNKDSTGITILNITRDKQPSSSWTHAPDISNPEAAWGSSDEHWLIYQDEAARDRLVIRSLVSSAMHKIEHIIGWRANSQRVAYSTQTRLAWLTPAGNSNRAVSVFSIGFIHAYLLKQIFR